MLLLAVATVGLLGGCSSGQRNVAVYLLADATGALHAADPAVTGVISGTVTGIVTGGATGPLGGVIASSRGAVTTLRGVETRDATGSSRHSIMPTSGLDAWAWAEIGMRPAR